MSMKGLNAPVRTYKNGEWVLTHPQLREEPEAGPSDVTGVWWHSDTDEYPEPTDRNRNMDIYNGTLFQAQKSGDFTALDISDPERPTQRDTVDLGSALGVRITDDGYAYVGPSYSSPHTDDQLKVIDVSDPDNFGTPSYHQSNMIDAGSHGMALGPNQDYLYITTWGSTPTGVASVDISDRENPQFLNHLDFAQAHDLVVESQGNYAFLATHETKMAAIDISDPTNMSVADSLDYTSQVTGAGARLSDDENYFFFGAGEDPGNFYSIDVSDPTALSEADVVSAARPYRLRVDGDVAYGITTGSKTNPPDAKLHAWDISDPTNVTYLGGTGQHMNGNTELELHPRSDHIYTGATSDTHRISVARPTYDRTLWSYSGSTTGWAAAADDRDMYAADGPDLYRFTPRYGHKRSLYTASDTIRDLALGPAVYTADTDNVVAKVDPLTGEELATHTQHASTVFGLTYAASEGVVVGGDNDGSIIAYDFVDGSTMWSKSSFDATRVFGLAYESGTVYAALSNDQAVVALDAADGTEIWRHTQHTDTVADVWVQDGVVYSAGWDNTVIAYDPGASPSGTNPGSTVWSKSHHTDNVTRVRAYADIVVSASSDNSVIVMDVSDGSQLHSHSKHTNDVEGLAIWRNTVLSTGRDNEVIAYG